MDVSVLATATRQPACWDEPQVFANLALDYDPADEDYAHLDAEGHAAAAEAKTLAEEAAVDVCMGCPLMLACEEMDAQTSARPGSVFVHGVIGGRTEDERLARLGRRRTAATVAPANPQIAPGDRGPRMQVDDALVARLTIAGKTGEQIAHDLGCSVRTVTRARKRMGNVLNGTGDLTLTVAETPTETRTGSPVANALTTSAPEAAVRASGPISVEAIVAAAPTANADVKPVRAKRTASSKTASKSGATSDTDSRNPFRNRPISPAMEAVYDRLATDNGASFADLKDIAAAQIGDQEAMDWWLNRNTSVENGARIVRPSKVKMSESERLREGALAKAHNAIDAAVRAGRYLSKQGDTVTLLPSALVAWHERKAAIAANAANAKALVAA